MLLQRVKKSGRRRFQVRWRYFSLTQVNSDRDGWTVWDAPEDEPVRGRLAFKAAEAARRQGRFESMHQALLDAHHRDQADLDQRETIEELARQEDLDLGRFRKDLAARGILRALKADHQHGVQEHGVFGTPTFVFPNGAAAYVRMRPAPAGRAALQLFDQLTRAIAREPYLLEVKRPARPLTPAAERGPTGRS